MYNEKEHKKLLKILEQYKDLTENEDEILELINQAETYESIDWILKEINTIIGGYGVEAINGEDTWVSHYYQDIIGLYVNMGDTYDTTVVFDTTEQEFFICSWGDWYEEWESEHQEDKCLHENITVRMTVVKITDYELQDRSGTYEETNIDYDEDATSYETAIVICNDCNETLDINDIEI